MKLTITTNTTTWFERPVNAKEATLRISFLSGATGTAKVVVATNPDDANTIGPGKKGDTQVSFSGGGTYPSEYVDVSGWKYIGIETTSISGTVEAELLNIP